MSRRRRKGDGGLDSNPQLVATARFIRKLLPGDDTVQNEALPRQVQGLADELDPKRPSAIRELGFGALQTWQALSEAQRRGRGKAEVAILFTDLVGFSDWALEAGDEAALDLLRLVGDAEQAAISEHQGALVKRLGDGAMAVFSQTDQAVAAALDAQDRAGEIEADGYEPAIRAGVHHGRPRRVRRDYLGVDVNIAARVGDAAKGGEILVSGTAREQLDGKRFSFGRKRELTAQGAPEGLTVCSVKAKK